MADRTRAASRIESSGVSSLSTTAAPPIRTDLGDRASRDPLVALTVTVILLIGLPSRLIVGPLGAAGTPANIMGMLCFLWWCLSRLSETKGFARTTQPVRTGLWIYGAAVLASYTAGAVRAGITGEEISSADRAVLSLLASFGIALVAADGLQTDKQLNQLLKRLVAGGVFLAILGIIQFATGWNPVGQIRLPGLVANHPFGLLVERSAFRRVEGTAIHPIEFGVVLALIFPMALHYAMTSPARTRKRWWTGALLIAVALPMTVARSAVLGGFVVLVILFPSWKATQRWKALIVIPVFLFAMRLFIPGLLGTLRSMFLNASTDNSVKGRTEDYAAVAHFISQRPVFGRGYGTFLPQLYRILDNQYLGTIVEAGFFGLATLLLLMAVGYFTARGARMRSGADDATRSLAQSLAASLGAALVCFVTFDAFSFPMVTGVYFLILGCAGAAWRLRGGFRRTSNVNVG